MRRSTIDPRQLLLEPAISTNASYTTHNAICICLTSIYRADRR